MLTKVAVILRILYLLSVLHGGSGTTSSQLSQQLCALFPLSLDDRLLVRVLAVYLDVQVLIAALLLLLLLRSPVISSIAPVLVPVFISAPTSPPAPPVIPPVPVPFSFSLLVSEVSFLPLLFCCFVSCLPSNSMVRPFQ